MLVILIFNYPIAFAQDICNMNGDWFDPVSSKQFYFQQEGANFTGKIKAPLPSCNTNIKGDVHSKSVSLYMYPAKYNDSCNFLISVTAEFVPDCLSLSGFWTNTVDGKIIESGSLMLLRNPIKLIGPEETVITAEPRMPNVLIKGVVEGPLLRKFKSLEVPAYMWTINVTNTYIPHHHITAKEVKLTDEFLFQPDFSDLYVFHEDDKDSKPTRHIEGNIIGGELTFSVDYYQNIHEEKKVTILGTNPGQEAIEQMITDKTLRHVACQESRYRQFKAKREGGIGYPLGKKCGVGIMQLCKPVATPEKTWDWRENVKAGTKLYQVKYNRAHLLANIALIDMNKQRLKAGLAQCTTLPPRLNEEQMQRQIIRSYNCGDEYQWQPWDDPECKAQWILDPTCRIEHPDGYDAEYVDRVLGCDINH